ncbi:Rho guanine nucleotide exchange factor, putative [Hondaea fermentalgiana]|uniref:Rho guanine nucleotide exchange factor, putative n=1 Tax=Hondaea fermentalgiana TaxID=2315210 RepID=A0A2R5GZR0_9STRA|nr:Rho guanine nucleotide exchange factor, putative [Hondaea fermentalgiana]|eukprot:GBG33534.1 Rho guanine nucleotide exchange factor, putative [Hondaea fermentalgiana]
MTLESSLADLMGLEHLLEVYEELGGEAEPELEDLVNPYRRCLGAYEVLLKEAPFATAVADEAKCYLTNDVLLVALNTNMKSKSARQKRTGTLDKKDSTKGTIEIKKGTLTRFKGKYKLLHYLDLHNCKVREVGTNDEGFTGIQITHVHRVVVNPTKRNGTMKIMTKIAKMELWFPTEELAIEMHENFLNAVAEEDEEDFNEGDTEDGAGDGAAATTGARRVTGLKRFSLGRKSSMSAQSVGSATTGGGRHRKWATNRSRRTTLEKSVSQASPAPEDGKGLSRTGSFVSRGGTSVGGDSVGGLQLSDLEQRYNVVLTHGTVPGDDPNTSSFEVEFGEGPMGLSIGSAPGLGVIVGALADGGFAEMAGVLISDRVSAINDEVVGLDDHWQDVLRKLKEYERPVRLRFERFAARTNELLKQNSKLAATRTPVSKGGETSASSHAKAKELEKILAKTSRVLARGSEMQDILANLRDSSELASRGDGRASASVLDEIFRTELTYVHDLECLMSIYVLPLRNEGVKTKCRDIEGGSVMCEHGLRSTCRSYSKDLQPLVSQDDLKGIFLNVETLMFVNVELLRILEMKLSEITAGGKTPPLAEVIGAFSASFRSVMPFFKLYSEFCHQYTHAVDRLLLLRSTKMGVDDFIKGIERAQMDEPDPSKRTLSLSSLLIKPVQRICKYPLLFHELIKHASTCVSDLSDLERTAAEVERIASSVNNQVGESKQFEEFMNVYRDLGGEAQVPDLVKPSRRFVEEILVLFKGTPFDSTKAHPRSLFIFNDLLIIAKDTSSGTLTRHRSLARGSVRRHDSMATATTEEGTVGRSISRFISSIFGAGDETGKGTRKTLTRRNRNLKVTHQFDLERCQLSEVTTGGSDKQPEFQFVLTAKERVMDMDGKSTMSSSGTGKLRTEINRYMFIFGDEEYMQEAYDLLKSTLNELNARAQVTARGKVEHGARKERRNWAKKSNGALRARVEKGTD